MSAKALLMNHTDYGALTNYKVYCFELKFS